MAEAHDKAESHGEGGHSGGGGHKSGHGHGGGGGHGEGHEGAPEWLISFADNVALMMGFFVVLLAMNMAKESVGGGGEKGEHGEAAKSEEQMLDFAIAVREAFHNPVDVNSKDPRDLALIKRLRDRAGRSETTDPGTKGQEQDVQSIEPSEYYAFSGSIPFGENLSEFSTSAFETLDQIAAKATGLRLVVEVRGHVSSVEATRGPEYAMRLSADRAVAVSKALAERGVDWWQLQLVLCADHDRAEAFPTSRSADKANARVEVIVTDRIVPDRVPTRYGDGKTTDTIAPESGKANPSAASPGH